MNQVPIAFFEDVLSLAFVEGYKCRHSLFSGSFGKCALRFCELGHLKELTLQNGNLKERACRYYGLDGTPETNHTKFNPKFLLCKYLNYSVQGNEVPSIAASLPAEITNFMEEPGLFCLDLRSSTIDDKWIKLFCSWQRLQQVEIRDVLTQSVSDLLNVLLNQEQLLYLTVSTTNYTTAGIQLFCKFLLQKQFLGLYLETYGDEVGTKIINTREESKELLKGKMVYWFAKTVLPDDTFERSEAKAFDFIRFENGEMEVDYCNLTQTTDIKEEEYLKDATRTIWRFL
ncbi:hypothetical protein L596_017716 [Steinernema carpocapsae]|uniref:F-box associated domain-containing protein n=1 Tax=Steinernema carpocapsae TaxID=34508 RepID=A0A4U5N2U8_STECR|nr:hypothetical protein L596_017716 [Steinernema carpocapsae]